MLRSDKTPVLFLPPYSVDYEVVKWMNTLPSLLAPIVKRPITLMYSDPPYEDDGPEATPFFMRPIHNTEDGKRKLLRKQILASIVGVLGNVVVKRPKILTGIGQGALISFLCTRPLL